MIIIHRIAISLALAILGALVPVAPGGTDQTFSRTDAAGARSLLTDALGSTVGLTDAAR